jgi:hypothetical protein
MATTKKVAKKSDAKKRGVSIAGVRKIALALEGVEEGTSYGTLAFKWKKKLLARMKEDGETLVVRAPFELGDALMESDPETFFITDHYANYPAVLVRLSRVTSEELTALIGQAWEGAAAEPRRKR